jgi:hypothetical protein
MKLRRLNAEGLRLFAEYLDALKATPALPPPVALLTDDATSEQAASVEIARQTFGSRFAAGQWLHDTLEAARLADVARDAGLWAWLSLLHFDEVCPPDGRGHRKPGERARHIPDVGNFQRYYRHLLAGPWRIYRTHRDDPARALVVLCQPLHTPGDLVEQLASRQELVTNRAFLAAATTLYVDPQTQQPKRGGGGKSRGTARRLADFCNQIDVTWDLYALSPGELLAKLPKEFQRFQPVA